MVGELFRKHQFQDSPPVFKTVGSPEIPRVCEKGKSGSKSFVEPLYWPTAILDAIGQFGLANLHLMDALLIGRDNRVARRIDDPVEHLLDLPFDLRQLLLHRGGMCLRRLNPRCPEVAEHYKSHREQVLRWRQLFQERFEFAFELVAGDGFTVFRAVLVEAHVVWIAPVPAFRPAGGHLVAAAAAGDETAQREILADIGPRHDLDRPF
nr:hypothetical protein [Jiella mangrovi]